MQQASTEQQTKRSYQPHQRAGQRSPRITVVLPPDCAQEIRQRATAEGMSESGTVASLVIAALAAEREGREGGQQEQEQTAA